MAEDKLQVNVDFTGFPDLFKDLEQMVEEDMTDRSKFIRRLVRQEKSRRQQLELSVAVDSSVSETTVVKKGTKRASAAVPA